MWETVIMPDNDRKNFPRRCSLEKKFTYFLIQRNLSGENLKWLLMRLSWGHRRINKKNNSWLDISRSNHHTPNLFKCFLIIKSEIHHKIPILHWILHILQRNHVNSAPCKLQISSKHPQIFCSECKIHPTSSLQSKR